MSYGWLSPNGDFIKAEFEGHYSCAGDILINTYHQNLQGWNSDDAYDFLYEKGWSRIADEYIVFTDDKAKNAIVQFISQRYINSRVIIIKETSSIDTREKVIFDGIGKEFIQSDLFEKQQVKLKELAKHYNFTKGKTGWLSPDGKFYPCVFDMHYEVGYRIIEKLYPKYLKQLLSAKNINTQGGDQITDFLEKMGYSIIHDETIGYNDKAKDAIIEFVRKFYMNKNIELYDMKNKLIYNGLGKDFIEKGLFENNQVKLQDLKPITKAKCGWCGKDKETVLGMCYNCNKFPSKQIYKEIEIGTKVEMEHTKNSKIAQKICMDHISEDPKYYSKLATIHKDT